jgi:hypothetical protein
MKKSVLSLFLISLLLLTACSSQKQEVPDEPHTPEVVQVGGEEEEKQQVVPVKETVEPVEPEVLPEGVSQNKGSKAVEFFYLIDKDYNTATMTHVTFTIRNIFPETIKPRIMFILEDKSSKQRIVKNYDYSKIEPGYQYRVEELIDLNLDPAKQAKEITVILLDESMIERGRAFKQFIPSS